MAPAETSGRALALQAVARAFTLHAGFAAERLDLGALPAFAVARGRWERALVEVSLRAMLFPGHRLVVDDQAAEACGPALPALLTSWVAAGAGIGLVVAPTGSAPISPLPDALRSAFEVACATADAREAGVLRGAELALAEAVLRSAEEMLRRIDRLGLAGALGRQGWLGEEGLERTTPGDPATEWAWRGSGSRVDASDPVVG